MNILVTGFDPFGGEEINPSWEAVSRLPHQIEGAALIPLRLPVTYRGAEALIRQEIERLHPDFVVSVGQAGGRKGITLERIAINMDDASIPDNEGILKRDVPIRANGDAAYFSTLPLRSMLKAIAEENLPVSISNTAGTFICNHILYCALELIRRQNLSTRAGFIHVPFLPRQCADRKEMPCMELSEIIRGLEAALRALIVSQH